MKIYVIHLADPKWRIVVSTIGLAEEWADHHNRSNPFGARATIEPVHVIEVGPPGKKVMS